MIDAYEEIRVGEAIEGSCFAVTRETIREFCDASLDYNPLHLDDEYMKGEFGKTQFGGIIMHGMTNFGLITRMLTDWLYERGGVHRRLSSCAISARSSSPPAKRWPSSPGTWRQPWARDDAATTQSSAPAVFRRTRRDPRPLRRCGAWRHAARRASRKRIRPPSP
ncbi:MAG: MaoC family dehydratase, partial [Burkholderiales bacterium]